MTRPRGCLAKTINPSNPYWLSRLRITGVKILDELPEDRLQQSGVGGYRAIRSFF